jgi:hypothetical protein
VVAFPGPFPQTFFWLLTKWVMSISPSESFDSRVRDAGGLVVYSDSELSEEDDSDEESVVSRPDTRHGRQPRRHSRSRARSPHHSRSRSPIRRRVPQSPAERDVALPTPSVSTPSSNGQHISKDKAKSLKKLMARGLSPTTAKRLREAVNLNFEGGSNPLQCPQLDHSMKRRLTDLKINKGVVISDKNWLSAQYKVLDAGKPLVALANGYDSMSDVEIKGLINTALSLLCNAFHDITSRHRKAILRHTTPSFLGLLSDESAFSVKESDRLFGKKFISLMAHKPKFLGPLIGRVSLLG